MRLLAPLCSVVICVAVFSVGYVLDAKEVEVDLIYIVAGLFGILNHIVGLWYAAKVRDQGFIPILLVSLFPIAAIGSVLLPINGLIRIVLGNYGSASYMIILTPVMWLIARKSFVRLRVA